MGLLKLLKTAKLVMSKKGADAAGAGKIVTTVIGIVIAIAMIPVVVSSVNAVLPNVSGASLILVGLITLIFVAGIIILAIKKLF